MTFFVHIRDDEEEEIDEEGASIDDDLLAELEDSTDETAGDDHVEGFGAVPEEEERALDKVLEKGDDDDSEEDLEEDAEDVDFDTFDDVDEF